MSKKGLLLPDIKPDDVMCPYYTLDENNPLRKKCLNNQCPKEFGINCKLKDDFLHNKTMDVRL